MSTIYDSLMAKAAEWHATYDYNSEEGTRCANELEALARQVCADAGVGVSDDTIIDGNEEGEFNEWYSVFFYDTRLMSPKDVAAIVWSCAWSGGEAAALKHARSIIGGPSAT